MPRHTPYYALSHARLSPYAVAFITTPRHYYATRVYYDRHWRHLPFTVGQPYVCRITVIVYYNIGAYAGYAKQIRQFIDEDVIHIDVDMASYATYSYTDVGMLRHDGHFKIFAFGHIHYLHCHYCRHESCHLPLSPKVIRRVTLIRYAFH